MSLSSLVVPTKEVVVGESVFTVQALCVSDLAVLATNHKEALERLFSGEFNIISVASEAPELAVAIIALATVDTADNLEDIIRKLPLGIQVEALSYVWELSIPNPKTLAVVVKSLSSLMGQA